MVRLPVNGAIWPCYRNLFLTRAIFPINVGEASPSPCEDSPLAFDPESLCVLSYARGRRQPRGFTHWYYWSEAPEEVFLPGFFDAAADLMRAGDIVFAGGSNGTVQLAVVSVRDGEKRPGHVYRQGGGVAVARISGSLREAPRVPGASAPPRIGPGTPPEAA